MHMPPIQMPTIGVLTKISFIPTADLRLKVVTREEMWSQTADRHKLRACPAMTLHSLICLNTMKDMAAHADRAFRILRYTKTLKKESTNRSQEWRAPTTP